MRFLRSLSPALSLRMLSAVTDTDLGGFGTWVSGMALGLKVVTLGQCGTSAVWPGWACQRQGSTSGAGAGGLTGW
jgi:hypothetical protein